ncbi:phosphotransacetylase family protein [Desulfonatronovibrio hydrogenovorans]|uniref:phosphotransacetylase family protein n=1 Tax=Desulfonatronovibrio hydrogenovorans TaxID=53245 RepID=UPI00048E48C2|nr:phosphotransacetylase family protein [Desulfonatronovibrio hydrogenovorans]
MLGLYIGSTSGYSGKNMIAMSIGKKFQKMGYNVGYMKPVGVLPREVDGKRGDEDAFFVQEVLGLTEDPAKVTPVLVDQDFKVKAFKGQCSDLLPVIEKEYLELSRDKDIMIVSGSGSMYSGKYCGLDGVNIVRQLGLKCIVIDRFNKELNYDYLTVLKDALGENMIGAILNDIPPYFNEELTSMLSPFLEGKGIKILGVIPRDPLMGAIKVSALASRLGGRVISAPDKADRVVENFIIGTMQVENFMLHFKKSKRSAVIVGGDRSDVQLVALEGAAQCLILTGNLYPNDIILTRSEVLGIPIILVRDDTYAVAKEMDALLSRHKLRDAIKIQHGSQLVNSSLDYQFINQVLDLK